jgi:hypothetical protein
VSQMDQPEDLSGSSGKPSQETTSPLLADLLSLHLTLCSNCQPDQRPVGLGGKSRLCSGYWELVQKWADREGQLNNVVAHDEYGNQADTQLGKSPPWNLYQP